MEIMRNIDEAIASFLEYVYLFMFRDIDVDNFIIDNLIVVKDGIQRAHEAHDFWGLHLLLIF